LVKDTASDAIGALKKKVHDKWAGMGLSPRLSHYDPTDLVVWQLKGESIIQDLPRDLFDEKLAKIDVEDDETIRLLVEEDKVVDLGLLVGQSQSCNCLVRHVTYFYICRLCSHTVHGHHEICKTRV
jgi:hypothetical protein